MQVPSTSLSKSNTLSDSAFDELLALADAAWAHSNALLPGNDEGMMDQYPSILTSKSYCMDDTLTNPTNKLLSHHHLSSLEQHSIIHEHDNPQGTSCTTCCSITTSQVAPPIPDNGIGAGKKPAQAMQMNMEEKDQGEKMINASAIRIDNNGTPLSKEAQPKRTQKPVSPKPAQSNNGQTEQSMCARRKISPTVVTVVESTKNMMPESAKSCCNRYLNFDKGASNENSADKENATVHPGIEIGVVASEMNAGIACELNSSMKQASNYTSFPNDKKAPGTSSKSNLPGEKPKVIPAAKRKCVRRKGLNKNSTPPTEMTEFTEELPEYAKMSRGRSLNPDIGARDERSAGRKSGVIVQETNFGLAYDLNASVKHASSSFMSFPGGTQAPDISSQRTRPGINPKENPTGKRKYVTRKELKKTSAPPTEVAGEMTTEKMPKFAKPPCKSSMNFDKAEIEESSAVEENATIHLSKEIVVTQEMNPDLAYDVNTSMKQASQSYMSSTEDTQATNTSSRRNPHGAKPKESSTSERKYVRRSALNKSSTLEEGNGAVACYELSLGAEKISNSQDVSVPAATVSDIAGENGKTCEQTTSDNLSGWTDLGSAQYLLSAVTASANSYATQLGNNNGLNDLFIPSVIHDNSGDPHGTSDYACCSKRTSQNTTLTPDNAIKMQINLEEKDRGGEEMNVSGKKLDDAGTPPNKVLCDPVIEFAAVTSPFKENHNPDEESIHYIDLDKTPQQKPKRRKIRPKIIREGKPKRSRKPVSPKPVQSKENPTGKRKYVRKKGLNKTCTPSTEVTGELTEEMPESAKMSCRRSLNFDKGARDESSADRENTTVYLCKEIGLVMQEMDVGLAYDMNTSMRQAAANNYASFPNEQTPSTSPSKNNPPGAKPKENLAGKQEFKEMSRRRSSNSDIGIKDESSACREISDVQIGNVVEETPVSLAYNQDTWMEQALNSYRSLPEDTQSPSTYPSKSNLPGAKPKENPTGKRKYVRKEKLNSTATPIEMTGENGTVYLCKEIGLVIQEMDVGLAHDMNTSTGQAAANNYASLPNEQTPSTSPSKNNPPGAKLNANSVENKNKKKGLATAQDGNINNSQISTTGLQMVGYKRKHSGTIKCAYNSSMDLIGAHYNGLPSDESKFRIQFPNIQKRRRTEMRKTSNTHITSSVTSKKEVPLTCTQEVAKAHPCASNSNCWMYGGSAYNSIIHNAQTFDEFILTLRRVTGSSQPPAQTYDCNSQTRIRNSDFEANYNAKQLGISDWQTFGDADRPQTCVDFLAKEMQVTCAKKKRSRKRRTLSSSAHSTANETQQHHNFAWGNHHLPLGKSSDIAQEEIWKSMRNVEAIGEQVRQLNINTE